MSIYPSGYYVYAYLRKNDLTPYYIGKGKADRAWQSHSIKIPSDQARIIILEENLTNVGACAIERRLIQWYGRKDLNTGILRNMTDGGDGSPGMIQTANHKQKNSQANTGIKWWNDGKVNIRSHTYPGNSWSRGRIKGRNPGIGRKFWNNGSQIVMSKTCPGPCWQPGVILTEKEVTRRQNSGKSSKGKLWWNNGAVNTMMAEKPGPEWRRGQCLSDDEREARRLRRRASNMAKNQV